MIIILIIIMMMKRQLSSSPPPHQFSWPWLPREYPALGFVCATHAHSHSYFFLLHWLLRHLGGGGSVPVRFQFLRPLQPMSFISELLHSRLVRPLCGFQPLRDLFLPSNRKKRGANSVFHLARKIFAVYIKRRRRPTGGNTKQSSLY